MASSSAGLKWTLSDLTDLHQRQEHYAAVLGGAAGIAAGLGVDTASGLPPGETPATSAASAGPPDPGAAECVRQSVYGRNEVPTTPPRSIFLLFFDALKDFTLIVLIVAAVVSIGLGVGLGTHPETEWIEGAAILIAVFLVSCVTAGQWHVCPFLLGGGGVATGSIVLGCRHGPFFFFFFFFFFLFCFFLNFLFGGVLAI
jgi:hypothetical protein